MNELPKINLQNAIEMSQMLKVWDYAIINLVGNPCYIIECQIGCFKNVTISYHRAENHMMIWNGNKNDERSIVELYAGYVGLDANVDHIDDLMEYVATLIKDQMVSEMESIEPVIKLVGYTDTIQ